MSKKRYFLTLRRITNFDYRLRRFKTRLKNSAQKMLGINDINVAMNNIVYEVYDLMQRGDVSLFVPKIANVEQTIEEILQSERSLVRFGDGEFKYMFFGSSIGFQSFDPKLADRLKEVLASKDERIMIAILDIFGYLTSKKTEMRELAVRLRPHVYGCIDRECQYYDAMVSRSHHLPNYFDRMKRIWDGKDIVLIEGAMTRMGIGNDLFDNAQSVRRILTPAEDAFSVYGKILDAAMSVEKSALFLIALGPTATVLAYDLGRAGYRALDMGHLDICYELFLGGHPHMVPIKGKYVNEVSYRTYVPCHDPKYQEQILCTILPEKS